MTEKDVPRQLSILNDKEDSQMHSEGSKHGIIPSGEYETTMETTGSTLAIMGLVEHVRNGGTLEFTSLGIVVTKEDLEGYSTAIELPKSRI